MPREAPQPGDGGVPLFKSHGGALVKLYAVSIVIAFAVIECLYASGVNTLGQLIAGVATAEVVYRIVDSAPWRQSGAGAKPKKEN